MKKLLFIALSLLSVGSVMCKLSIEQDEWVSTPAERDSEEMVYEPRLVGSTVLAADEAAGDAVVGAANVADSAVIGAEGIVGGTLGVLGL